MNQQQIRQLQRNQSIKHRKNEKQVEKLINIVFAKQSKIITNFVSNHGISAGISHIHRLITPELMRLALRRCWLAVARDYHDITLLTRKSAGGPPVKTFVTDYANSGAAMKKVTDITDITRERLVNTLRQAGDDKLAKRDVAKRIRESTGFSAKRSLLIARTETTMAANIGAYGSAMASGLNLEKYWIATDDNRTRDSHAEMLGSKPLPMDEAFEVGSSLMMYPGDPSAPAEEVCNCRCILAFRPVEEQQSADTPDAEQARARRRPTPNTIPIQPGAGDNEGNIITDLRNIVARLNGEGDNSI